MKKYILFLIAIFTLLSSFSLAKSVEEIIKVVDESRAVSTNYEMKITLEYYKNEKLADRNILKGYIKDYSKSMIEFLEPSNMKGRKLLTLNDDMWMFFPNTKRPVRISASQRLMGGFSNGDIAKTSFSLDYDATLAGEEEVDGKICYKVELSAKRNTTTYNKITLWADKESGLPVKADFYALSGKKLKSALYKEPKKIEGKTIITKIYIYDAVVTSEYSIMVYEEMKNSNTPDKYFTKEYLERM